MTKIDSYSIKDFKSFGSEQSVPLSKINLLFGPNSHGKTATLQSLGILQEALLTGNIELEKISYIDSSPHINISENLVNNDSGTEVFTLSAQFKLKNFHNLKVEYRFTLSGLERGGLKKFEVFEQKSEQKKLALSAGSDVIINLNSELVERYMKQLGENLKDLKENYSTVGNELHIDDMRISSNKGLRVEAIRNFDKRISYLPTMAVLHASTVNELIENLFHMSRAKSLKGLTDWIGPNRTVTDKTFIVDENKPYNEGKRNELVHNTYLMKPIIRELNDWLKSTDTIHLDYELILNSIEAKSFSKPIVLKEFGLRHLRQEKSNFLALSDVGSGISHVLQILLPFFAGAEQVVIQQPEMHLHPGLQANLARAIIELSNKFGTQVIIETHSEHFIKAAQLEIAKSLSQYKPTLTSEDLNVLYISKNEEGFSTVRRIKVDETGSFTEPWPDDFFELSADLSLERLRQSYKSRN